jgi:hypothetical protein
MSTPAAKTPEPSKLETSATTCIVGCKLSNGLTVELFSGKIGSDRRTVWKQTLKGMNDVRIVGGYGLTHGVDTEKMTEWLKRNAEHPAVKNGLIFMHTEVAGAKDRAREGREIRTGLEAINPLDKSTKAQFKIALDEEGEKAYRKQIAENPVRERQIQE